MKRPSELRPPVTAPRDVSEAEQIVRDAAPRVLSPREKAKLAAEAVRDDDA
jgi:hypothetical protein